MMNRKEYEKYLTEIVLAFTLPIIVLFIYDAQIRVFKYDSGLWLFLLLCIVECCLAIIINLNEKNNNVPSKKWREHVKKWKMKT